VEREGKVGDRGKMERKVEKKGKEGRERWVMKGRWVIEGRWRERER
jgi:predicted Holliday junction resolvase-like endonuclease